MTNVVAVFWIATASHGFRGVYSRLNEYSNVSPLPKWCVKWGVYYRETIRYHYREITGLFSFYRRVHNLSKDVSW